MNAVLLDAVWSWRIHFCFLVLVVVGKPLAVYVKTPLILNLVITPKALAHSVDWRVFADIVLVEHGGSPSFFIATTNARVFAFSSHFLAEQLIHKFSSQRETSWSMPDFVGQL